MRKIRTYCDEIDDLLIGNEIFQARTRGVGIIPRDIALQYGLSGPNLRASGVDWDLRRDQRLPMAWDKADWKVWTHPDGDSFARCWMRLQETREATKIVDQLLDGLPAGPIMAKVPRIIKVPEGEAWVSTENPLGEMGYYVVSKGDLGPFRVKIRSASFNNVSIASWVLRGVYVPDIITILASLYFILGTSTDDVDRCSSPLDIPYWGQSSAAVLGGIVAVLLPAGTIVYVFLFKMMSFMQSRLGPMEAGPVRLAAAVRRGRQVAAEGGHRAGRRRPPHLQDGAAHRARVDVPARRRRAVRPRRLADELPGRRVLRPRRVVDQRARHPRRRLVERQQVLAARRPARRRPAHRLRAAARARRHRRGHPGRVDELPGDRRRARTPTRSSAGTDSATRTCSPSSSASSCS